MLPLAPYTPPDCRGEAGEGRGNAAASAAAAAREGSAAALSSAACRSRRVRESRQINGHHGLLHGRHVPQNGEPLHNSGACLQG